MARRGRRRRGLQRDFQHRTQPGAPPGVLVPVPGAASAQIQVIAYGPDGFEEHSIDTVGAIPSFVSRWPVTWVNVDGVDDAVTIHEIGRQFGLHRLALEDVVHVHQRAKAEFYGDVLFVVLRAPIPGSECETEQISVFMGSRFVVTFQERPGRDCFDGLRNRIRSGFSRGRIASDYLMYAVIDGIIDHYFPLLEQVGDRLDAIEDATLAHTARGRGIMPAIHSIRRDLQTVRRAVWPLRDAITSLLRDPSPLLSDETRVYLRDCQDHSIQLIDLVENYRELSSALAEVHLSTVANYTNQIMRVLTIISTIFIPLTFLVGVYGQNFDYLPELHVWWAYPALWALMAAIAGAFIVAFWRMGWIFTGDAGASEPARDAASERHE